MLKKFCFGLTILTFLLGMGNVFADNSAILGKWQTIDDETGKPKSVVELYEQDGKVFGKIVQLFTEPGKNPDPVCTRCKDSRKNQKVVGMVIIENLVKADDVWKDGTILDPAKGEVYRCKVWLEKGNLEVRGYVGIFFRTQTWHREK